VNLQLRLLAEGQGAESAALLPHHQQSLR